MRAPPVIFFDDINVIIYTMHIYNITTSVLNQGILQSGLPGGNHSQNALPFTQGKLPFLQKTLPDTQE